MKNESFRWGIRLTRRDGVAEYERIMCDVDFHDSTNNSARKSKDTRWVEYPIVLAGPYITGRSEDGSTLPLHAGFLA